MRITVDNVFIKYLNEAGYEIDYKKLTEIYKTSRKDEIVIARKKVNDSVEAEFAKFMGWS